MQVVGWIVETDLLVSLQTSLDDIPHPSHLARSYEETNSSLISCVEMTGVSSIGCKVLQSCREK